MKLTFALLLCVVPVLWDLAAGRIYWRKKTTVNHFFTAGVRLAIIGILSYFNPDTTLLQSALLSVAFHYAFFPALYNRIILGREWDYVGTTAISDRIEAWIIERLSGWFIVWFKVCFLGTGIVYYIHGCLRCWQ